MKNESAQVPAADEGRLEASVMQLCCKCRFPLRIGASGFRHYGLGAAHQDSECLSLLRAEMDRLTNALKKANDQAEHFERLWYLTNEDAGRYAFAKTLEGQVVTMDTFKVRGAAELDQALDDAMAEAADAHNGGEHAA